MIGRLQLDERKNDLSMSCLKHPDNTQSPRKHRVTFDPSSKWQEEVVSSKGPQQRTLTIQPREHLTDSGERTLVTSSCASQPSKRSESYRRSLHNAYSKVGKNSKVGTSKTNGFHEDRTFSKQHVGRLQSLDDQALGSFTSTYQVHDDDKRCPSDQSFWSSDYSTSMGGASEKSNDSTDGSVYHQNRDLTKYTPIDMNQEGCTKMDSTEKKGESLQERLRQRLSIFQNEYLAVKKAVDISSLPEHILLNIFSYFSTRYLCNASSVCKKWHMLCWDPVLWKSMKISNYCGSDINKVLHTILSRLANNTQGLCLTLRHIRLVQCECLSDRGLGYVAKYCIDLEKLEVIGCPCIMSRGVQTVLENCLSLSSLDVRGCSCLNSICHSTLTNIQSSNNTFFHVKYLDISDCVAVDDLGLRALGLTCKNLETLHMRRCSRITDVGMQHIASHCLKLKELSISDCHKVRDFSLKEIAKYCSLLRYLSLMRCAVTDAGIKVIGKGCSNLRYLNIRGCTGVTDVGVIHIAQNCLKLRSLDVGKCDITNNSLSALGIHCPQLKRLSIKGCSRLTDVGIRAVVAQCCLLHYLNVEDCKITVDTYDFVREHCQNCVIEHTSLEIF